MIELKDNELVFNFPEIHPAAILRINFQRTLRIPDDDKTYPLPPGLGCFPLRQVDDFTSRVPSDWLDHGGVMLPMYQSEALWLHFRAEIDVDSYERYPFAVKIATGKVNAVSGQTWQNDLHSRPHQDYVVIPKQPWLDGYCVEKGIIRQFVAMPLGTGYTAEEQVTGKAEHGGLQIVAYPMKREIFEARFPKQPRRKEGLVRESCIMYASEKPISLGLAPGGRMKQDIYDDPFKLTDWDTDHGSRCFIHIANSMIWRQITGENPPTTPPTAKEYTRARLPWFTWYDDNATAITRSDVRRRHVGDLQVDDVGAVLTAGIADSETEKKNLQSWRNRSLTGKRILPWLKNDLRKKWGFKAATRAFHISTTGHDVEIIGPYRNADPTTIPVQMGERVKGTPELSENLFDLSQILAWLAKERRDLQEQIEWREQIPELLACISM